MIVLVSKISKQIPPVQVFTPQPELNSGLDVLIQCASSQSSVLNNYELFGSSDAPNNAVTSWMTDNLNRPSIVVVVGVEGLDRPLLGRQASRHFYEFI
jgi:hypothetical protein